MDGIQMLPLREIELFLENIPLQSKEIVLELRNIIFSVALDASEVIRWGGLSYFHQGRGGIVSAGICQIGIHDGFVQLAFIHGAFLPDPSNLLEGDKKAKRFVRIESYEGAPWETLIELIKSSSQFDPYSLKEKS
jgi:hypothetical protein